MDDLDAFAREVVARTAAAFRPAADAEQAGPMEAYMKGVAPFLGIRTTDRRRLQREAWKGLPAASSDELGRAARALMAEPERELHYAAADLLKRRHRALDAGFLDAHGEALLTTLPWWDTVDSFGSAFVVPLCARFDLLPVIRRWSGSGDRWLVRSAIQHQRGRKGETDVPLVLALCAQHAGDREFFVAKAIGWALRDLSALDPDAVEHFVAEQPGLGRVALREAEKGLARARG